MNGRVSATRFKVFFCSCSTRRTRLQNPTRPTHRPNFNRDKAFFRIRGVHAAGPSSPKTSCKRALFVAEDFIFEPVFPEYLRMKRHLADPSRAHHPRDKGAQPVFAGTGFACNIKTFTCQGRNVPRAIKERFLPSRRANFPSKPVAIYAANPACLQRFKWRNSRSAYDKNPNMRAPAQEPVIATMGEDWGCYR